MRTDKLIGLFSIVLVSTAACPAEDDGMTTSPSSVGESGSDSGSSTDPSATVGMTGMMSATSATSASTTTSDPTDTGTTTMDPVEPMPNGASCEENDECESGYCYFISILGGICGECNVDADCADGGCSLPNPLAQPPVGATCNSGEPGAGCMSDEICQDGLVCASILAVPGILEASTCSECITDEDCTEGNLCTPSYDILNISGQKLCVPPGTVPNGEGCDHLGSGSMACESGLCATVDIMMLLQLGVCGDCGVDADCTPPDVCLPADIDIATGMVTPPTCGPAA